MSYKATFKYPLCVKYTIRKEVYKLLKYGFIGDWSNTRNKKQSSTNSGDC